MKDKNKDLDKWYTKLRFPHERVFSHKRKRTRYIGVIKNQFMAIMGTICHNLKGLVILEINELRIS